jgi:hypothetical protein
MADHDIDRRVIGEHDLRKDALGANRAALRQPLEPLDYGMTGPLSTRPSRKSPRVILGGEAGVVKNLVLITSSDPRSCVARCETPVRISSQWYVTNTTERANTRAMRKIAA